MDYKAISKFKLNKLVAEKLGMCTDKDLISQHALTHDYNLRYPDTVWARRDGEPWEQFCFTNSPEEWALLVKDFSINLSFDTDSVTAKSCLSNSAPITLPKDDIGSAVCIAFLDLKDSEDSKVSKG